MNIPQINLPDNAASRPQPPISHPGPQPMPAHHGYNTHAPSNTPSSTSGVPYRYHFDAYGNPRS